MGEPNWANRTLFHGDNLEFLRGMNSGTVHLIATDPPFNKGKDFHATPDSLAAGARFQDRWSWDDDVHEEWVDQIEDDWPHVMEVIKGSRASYGDDMGAFLCFMGVRLLEMRRILCDDGSIYLHCDPTASHYLKELLDAIFGKKNFRNEIAWCYSGGGIPRKDFPRKHDLLLRYTKRNDYTFNIERKPYKENTQAVGIHSTYSGPDNRIDLERGTPVTDWWIDIPTVTGWNPERLGYPTQKPLGLYERIIKASSNEGDWVLDPFAGCATTCVAAERLGRQWVGMDIWDKAHETVIQRLQSEGLAAPDGSGERLLTFGQVGYSTVPPARTDDGEDAVPFLRVKVKRASEPWQRLSRDRIKERLIEAQVKDRDGLIICGGCGRVLEREFTEIDHIMPRADGGVNDITNRILLCQPCNGRKGANFTLRGLMRENRKVGWMRDEGLAKLAQHNARAMAERVRNELR